MTQNYIFKNISSPKEYENLKNLAIQYYFNIQHELTTLTNSKLNDQIYQNIINEIVNKCSFLLDNNYRILITVQDGTVIYDSSKQNNSFSSFDNKSINENHNSRVSILSALFSCEKFGIGFDEKISTSTGNRERYVAIRIGDRIIDSSGCFRLSIKID